VPNSKIGQDPLVNASRGTILSRSEGRAELKPKAVCSCCQRKYRAPRPKQKFCSNRCRLLYWAACEIARQFQAGKANGLRDIISGVKAK
jgi:hypothetical protein